MCKHFLLFLINVITLVKLCIKELILLKSKCIKIQVCHPVGCVPPSSVAATRCQSWRDLCLGRLYLGDLCRESLSKGVSVGVCVQGGPCLGRGLCRGGLPPEGDPPTREQINTSENITFPQLRWRAVNICNTYWELGALIVSE